MIELDNISINYGSLEVIKPLSLHIDKREFFTILGPSGCGKTTLLRAIAGFVPLSGGHIRIGGQDVTRVPAEKRDVGIVFQNYALFPHMTVTDNIAFGLRVARKPKREINDAVTRILQATGISDYRHKKPAELSGGQQQRVAIARSLVLGTQVLLFDEPLSNLDSKIREEMRYEIKTLQHELEFTAVFVTHDQEEALSMSDRLLVLNKGGVEQIGTARDLYQRPNTPFVCQFIGSANRIGDELANRLSMRGSEIYIRPEHLSIGEADAPDEKTVSGVIKDIDYLGAVTRLSVEIVDEILLVQVVSDPTVALLKRGQRVSVVIDTQKLYTFGGLK